MQPLQLCRELNITGEVAVSILRSIELPPMPMPITSDDPSDPNSTTTTTSSSSSSSLSLSAFQLSNLHEDKCIITFCRAIDVMLGGGVKVGQLTEIVGVPGIGKTQMCIQLALNVQLPQVMHTLDYSSNALIFF